jgi:hypothetical protein
MSRHSIVQQPKQLARESRRQLQALLPETVSSLWLDAWIAHNPGATVSDACEAMLKNQISSKQQRPQRHSSTSSERTYGSARAATTQSTECGRSAETDNPRC